MTNLSGTIFFLLTALGATAQQTLLLEQTLDWYRSSEERPAPVGQIAFDDSWYEYDIPYTLVERELARRYSSVTIGMLDVESEVVSPEDLTLQQRNRLPEGITPVARIAPGRNKQYVQVLYPALYRDGRSIRRVNGLRVEVQLTEPGSNSSRTIDWAANSVLAEGQWYKIGIAQDGIYRIDRDFLQSLGIDVNTINPQQISIYGNGGAQLPFDNSIDRPDDPQKNAIYVEGEADGSFDQSDYILFYGRGANSWSYDDEDGIYRHQRHEYSDSAYYFIRVDDPAPLRIAEAMDAGVGDQTVTAFTDRAFIENESVNLARSGREFYGNAFSTSQNIPFTFAMPFLRAEEGYCEVRVAARSVGAQSQFNVEVAGSTFGMVVDAVGTSSVSSVAQDEANATAFVPSAGANTLTVNVAFDQAVPDAQGWLDYILVNARRDLSFTGTQLSFRDPESVNPGAVNEYRIANAGNIFEVWDVTNPLLPQRITLTPDPDEPTAVTFTAPADQIREFIAFAGFNYLTPAPNGAVENQNLHSLNDIDLVVLTNDRFQSVAERYVEIHENDGLSIALVNVYQVYNEFSSGNPDVTAVKMLMKMLWDRANGNPELQPKYLQIIGDGTYLNRFLNRNSNAVITYQSSNSLSPVNSYVSDDYFGFLEDQYGEGIGDKMSIGVGRIPCGSVNAGFQYLDKLERYIASNSTPDGGAHCIGDANLSPYGAWRNMITLVADDFDGNGAPIEIQHTSNSEEHSDTIYNRYNDYDVVKIYMDAYQQETTPGGERYPDVNDAIRRRVENGSLIVNYIGHGGERGWAHERVLNTTTIQEFQNINRLPVFVTATCELARFDDPEAETAGEFLIMNPNGGAIAMLTTTRIVFSGSNQQLNRAFFDVALREETFGDDLTLGFISMETKNNDGVSNTSNKRNFSLLGDAALRMVYPREQVYTTAVNGTEINIAEPDTIRSLQEVTISGFVGDSNGNKLTGFNGFVYPTVYDKQSEVTTLNNDGAFSAFDYEVWNNVLYKGKASVTNGDFEFTFIVPRDIAYDFGAGRISYYAVDGDLDAHGHTEDFIIGGALEGAQLNDVGPEVNLYLNDSTFVFGGITDERPLIFAKVFDENGINTVGSGIGHDIKAVLDGNTNDPIILNDFYESDLDTYQSGSIRYQLNRLSDGTHNLSLKVWDVHNNSSEAYTEFVVASSADLALDHVLNYPNPFTTYTEFMFEHNQACDLLEVQVQVFTVSGKMVKSINRTVQTDGFRSEPISWDGLDDFGDAIGRGVYVYRVKVTTPEGQSAEKFERLVILR